MCEGKWTQIGQAGVLAATNSKLNPEKEKRNFEDSLLFDIPCRVRL